MFVGAMGFAASASASAQVDTESSVSYISHPLNWWTRDDNAYIYNFDASSSSSDINSYQRDFSVLDSQNNPTTTSFTGSAIASATHSSLSAYTRTTVVNPVPLGNNQQYMDDQGNLIPGGMPEGFMTHAYASMSDGINLQATNVASIQFKLGLEGSISGIDDGDWNRNIQWGSAQIGMYAPQANGNWRSSNVGAVSYHGVPDLSDWSWNYPTQSFQEEYLTNLIPVINGVANFSLHLDSYAEVDFWYSQIEGGTFDVTSDFANTLTILGINAFDSNGNLLNASLQLNGVSSLLGQSGTAYNLLATPIPDPESYILMLTGLGFLGSMMRRKTAVAA